MATRKRVVEAPRKRQAPQVHAIKVMILPDGDHDASFDSGDPDYSDEDERRRDQYERGDFVFVGVRAEAEVEIGGIIQRLTSGGLWGIESDSGREYIEEVGASEYSDLRKILTSIGVSTSQLPMEFDPKWIQEA
jgi:hypothetical protein